MKSRISVQFFANISGSLRSVCNETAVAIKQMARLVCLRTPQLAPTELHNDIANILLGDFSKFAVENFVGLEVTATCQWEPV